MVFIIDFRCHVFHPISSLWPKKKRPVFKSSNDSAISYSLLDYMLLCFAHFSRLECHPDVTLRGKPMTSYLPLTIAGQIYLKVPIQFKHDLPHLQNGYVFSNTASWAMTELEKNSIVSIRRKFRLHIDDCWTYRKQVPLHLFDLQVIILNPSLRAK